MRDVNVYGISCEKDMHKIEETSRGNRKRQSSMTYKVSYITCPEETYQMESKLYVCGLWNNTVKPHSVIHQLHLKLKSGFGEMG